MIADTNFIIDIMSRNPQALKKAAEVESRDSISVGAPTVFKLFVGVALSKKSEEEASKIMSTIASLSHLPLDFLSAKNGGIIYGDRARSGVKMDPEDAMLAGIARVQGEAVLTRNVKHFRGIEGVDVEDY